ncbi:IS3 family transposase [Fibrobacter sp.]|uniref:IS3 family transposase n=1 Tax=Fibrobacter sp. TaxID=35828 RepID=UPI0025B87D97|nr:IS3 family transposase [Fibrobacter sp.]
MKAGGLSRSTYYYNLHKRPDRYADERSRVKAVHAQNRSRYGYRRIMAQLRNESFLINHKTVYRLMKEENLKNVRRRNKYRSYKGEVGRTAPNILDRDFGTTAPNRKWTTDVTQINIGMDKCYLSPILDMYNGEIVSYTISDHPDLKMVMDMLEKAFVAREVRVG